MSEHPTPENHTPGVSASPLWEHTCGAEKSAETMIRMMPSGYHQLEECHAGVPVPSLLLYALELMGFGPYNQRYAPAPVRHTSGPNLICSSLDVRNNGRTYRSCSLNVQLRTNNKSEFTPIAIQKAQGQWPITAATPSHQYSVRLALASSSSRRCSVNHQKILHRLQNQQRMVPDIWRIGHPLVTPRQKRPQAGKFRCIILDHCWGHHHQPVSADSGMKLCDPSGWRSIRRISTGSGRRVPRNSEMMGPPPTSPHPHRTDRETGLSCPD